MAYVNVETSVEVENLVSSYELELETRIGRAISRIGSKKKACLLCSVSFDQLQRYIKGQSRVPLGFIHRLSVASGYSVDYLATGNSGGIAEPNAIYNVDEFVAVPVYNVQGAMGTGSVLYDELVTGSLKFRREWIQSKGWEAGKLAVIEGRGVSMQGVIDDRSPVLVDMRVTSIQGEYIYVALFNDMLIIKYMQTGPDGSIYINSENKAFQQIVVPPQDAQGLKIIGRAVWTSKNL